jgi:hypothetical protein
MEYKTVSNKIKIISAIFAIAAMALYLNSVWLFSLNIPYADDYDSVLGFLNQFVAAENYIQKATILFNQHNEHRLVFNHLVQLLFLGFGEINFRYLIFFGNFGWFILIYVIWRYSESREMSITEYSPVIITLLSFCAWETMTMATPAIQFHFQILFSIASILMMTRQKFTYAIIFTALSVFTSAGGLLSIPILCLYYLVEKKWSKLAIAIGCSFLLVFVYFTLLHYRQPTHHPDLLIALKMPIDFILFIFAVAGSFGMINKLGIASAITFGAISMTLFAIKAPFIYKKNSFLFWTAAYIFITILSIDLSRVGFGLEYSQSSRYTIFAILLLVVLYISYFDFFKNTKHRNNFFIYSLIFSIILFTYWYPRGNNSLKYLSIDLSQKVLRYPVQDQALNNVKKSRELNIFQSGWLRD